MYDFLYKRCMRRSTEQIIASIELKSSHAAYRDKFENEFFNIIVAVVEDFIKNACTRTCQEKIRIH